MCKLFGTQSFSGPKFCWDPNFFGTQKFCDPTFWVQKFSDQKSCLVMKQKTFGSKKILVKTFVDYKSFWFKQIFWMKKFFGSKNIFEKNCFWSKKLYKIKKILNIKLAFVHPALPNVEQTLTCI